MDTTTLTDRYIDAAMRTVPEKQRADLAAELRASIHDDIDARLEQGETRESAERAVLIGLGDPELLAARYTDRPLYLIGPRYFLDWWRLLKLLLWIVPPLAAFGIALGKTLSEAPLGDIIGTTVVGTLATVLHLAFWTTLVFAVIERVTPPSVPALGAAAAAPGLPRTTTPALLGEWTPDQLPEPRENGATFADMIASIVMLVIGAGAILWDLFLGFVPGMQLSFLHPDLWPWWIGGLFVVMAIEAVLAIVVHSAGRWTYPFAVMNAILAVTVAVPALWLLMQGRLLNPDFWPTLISDGHDAEVSQIVAIVWGFGIAAIAVWDILDAFLKARRAR